MFGRVVCMGKRAALPFVSRETNKPRFTSPRANKEVGRASDAGPLFHGVEGTNRGLSPDLSTSLSTTLSTAAAP